jgi:RNA polymerase-binding transcription factor DksA
VVGEERRMAMIRHVSVLEEIRLAFSQKLLSLLKENSGSLEYPGGTSSEPLNAKTFDRVAAFRYVPRYEEWKAALERLETGTYGACTLCNQPIPRKVLQHDPLARFCRECESKLGMTGTSFAGGNQLKGGNHETADRNTR